MSIPSNIFTFFLSIIIIKVIVLGYKKNRQEKSCIDQIVILHIFRPVDRMAVTTLYEFFRFPNSL